MCQNDTVKSFLYQTTHSIVMIKDPNALCVSLDEAFRFRTKILAASDMKSDNAIRCTLVLSLHLYGWEHYMYNESPERDQYIRAC